MDRSIKVLQDNNLKMTHARQMVLKFFLDATVPTTADDIFFFLAEMRCATDRATVYRILEAFREKGIINRIEFQEGKFRYEIAGSDHHHLICEKCGLISDISECGIEAWEKEIQVKKGFMVKRHSLEFFGECISCQR